MNNLITDNPHIVFSRHISDIQNDFYKSKLSDDEIHDKLNSIRSERYKMFQDLKIPDVVDDVFKLVALYAINCGYEIEDLDELIDAKIVSHFQSMYEEFHNKPMVS